MELMYSGQIYVSIYYIILCLSKIYCEKLMDIEILEYCKHLQCDETVQEKVCGVRTDNGINTYRIFDNECLLLKYGCQVGTDKAYGIINMKHCDEITSQENDGINCQTNCVSVIKDPVCGIRKDGEGFRIKMFSNICQLSKHNCEKQLQFIITDSFICNSYKSTIQRRNTDEQIYSEISEDFNDSNDTYDQKIKVLEKSDKSAEETNNTEWENENINNIETSTLETINLETSFEEISTKNSTEAYDVDTNTTNENNVNIETPPTIVNQEQNKTIVRNIVVVRGSPFDMQNINTSVADFFGATHVFDLPVREMEPKLTENTRRRLVKIFGPIKVFKPWLTKPDVIKEDRNHTPTLSSCFHKCPTKCPDTYAPVCGTPGIVAREPSLMFQNHCYMDVAQCKMFWENKSPTSHSSGRSKMSSKTEAVRSRRIVMAYDLDEVERLLKDVKVAQCMLTEPPTIVDEESVLKRLSALTLGNGCDGNYCSTCSVGPFVTRAQQTEHYKDHWHIHNIKRKLFGKKPHTLGQFKSKNGESSDSTGSESEADDDPSMAATELFAAATRHCKAFFTNAKEQVFCIYRCILHHRKEEMSLDGEGHVWSNRCKELLSAGFGRWAVFMVSGGHFAGCIFTGGVDAIHKTLHSYTTRRGQGQSQSTRDSHGNAPRSAGASLRRYNQEQFLLHVQDVLISWQEDLKGCALIFYRAVGSLNQAALFGKPSPLRKADPRVRMLPFPTRKPSFKEVKRVHQTLASIEVYETLEVFQKALLALPNKVPAKTTSDTSVEKRKKEKKAIDRAKSRERAPRELPTHPTQVISSEDEGPCYIDSETPADWIKTLSEQSSNGIITNSRKDLINEINDTIVVSSESEVEKEEKGEQKKEVRRKKKKKLEDKPIETKEPKKIPSNVKKMWKAIADKENTTLETIFESMECDLEAACNTQDPSDGNTALHKAAIAAKPDMVTQILSAGGDPCIKNNQLQTPYASSPHHETRIAFRLFQAQYPDKFNYSKSHIPGPVTAEQLEQEKEKKAQQKRAKRQRDKDRQIDKLKAQAFKQLTDAQKKQSPETRCFMCGAQLPKVPFEYDDCKFCQIPCLHSHRNIRPINKSVE